MRGGKYVVQASEDGVEWHAVTKPVTNKRVPLALMGAFASWNPRYSYRAFNRYTRRETFGDA